MEQAGVIRGLFGGGKEPGSVVIEPLNTELPVPKSQSILQAALDAGIDFPHSCKVGTCTQCRCRLVEGEIKQIRDFSYVLSNEEIRAGYILACQSRVKPGGRVRLQLAVEVGAPRHPQTTAPGRIVVQQPLTHDIVEVKVELDRPLRYTAGQYASISRPGLDRPRDYSFAAAPRTEGDTELTFFIRKVPGGEFTEWLFAQARTGEELTVTGPCGNFWLRQADAPLLLVAGGSGLAPILALLEDSLARKVSRNIVLLFGARQQRDLYGTDAINAIAARWPAEFRYTPVLSDEPEGSDWHGATGLVTGQITPELVPHLAQRHAYLCGPPAMIDAAIACLTGAGVSAANIHYDKFLDASNLV